MKRIAEMSDLKQVIRTLPRIKKHLFNPENMRSVWLCEQVPAIVAWILAPHRLF